MTLTTALNSSIKALDVAQQSIAIASNNIANVDTPGYIKQNAEQASVVAGGIGQGAEIIAILASVDAQLLKSIQSQTSELGQANALEEHYNNIQNLFGQPNSDNSLNTKLDDFFNAFQKLSTNPQTTSLRVATLNDAVELADTISTIATKLQELRLEVDRQIGSDVTTVNNLLSQLSNSNTEITNFSEGSQGRVTVEQQRELNLRKLAEYIDISSITDANGRLSVLTRSGTALLDSAGLYKITHSAAASVDNFINNNQLTAISVSRIQSDGTLSDVSSDIATSGVPSTITTNVQSGTLKGLLDLRNTEISKVLEQLDTLSDSLRNAVNTIHNDGSSYPPPSELIGTRATSSNTELGFSGKVMIAVLDSDGTPPTSPYTDESNYRPLTLDLASLNGGSGAGRPTVQTIIDEINNYYGPVQNRATIGNLRDMSLAVYPDTDSIADGGTVKFDLELDNISTEDASVVINSVSVSGAGNSSSVPAGTYVVNPGDRERTNIPFTVDFSGTNLASYTITVQATVTDASGNVSTANVEYTVADNIASGLRNDRYHASAVTNVAGTSEFHAAPASQSYANASLVDADGVAVAAGQSGFLKITTTSGENFGIAIDELDSAETGLPSTPSSSITNRGFSHYFELNNFFTANNNVTAGSAINMAVRSDIAANSSRIATGKLLLSNQPIDTTEALYTYELGIGSNEVAVEISELAQLSINFAATDTLPATSTTFSGYTGDIIGFVATTSFNKTNNRASEELGLDGLRDLLQETSGVNTDEELARIVELENNFRASARVISVIQDLFEILANSF